ncbi:MFS transporter [Blastococcus xanthinilyticus]|uniref:Sugar phosphate permease n=1 Tax=Blastococcus xanthinilyticus TaxID=1564164 RepID=A0A5S5CYQ8_9ACTN|nr:MFS transporter [Blastococcus xanthinilyticus]TYP88883.1 sugar phosphate permease [Blastococcus xanthinilyticus]
MTRATPAVAARPAYLGFAAFGALWGIWGAALPALRDAAGLTEGQLGMALLCIGAGALPAMLLTGRAVDRFQGRVVALALTLMAVAGVAVATAADDLLSLAVLALALGATSGAADVGINAVAGAAERAAGRPVLTRAHGVFSTAVVAGALGTGAIEGAGLPVAVAFGLAVVAALVAAGPLWRVRLATGDEPDAAAGPGTLQGRSWALPLVVIGLVGALAFAVENAHQSWSAVFLADELSVGSGLTAAAPAIFAGVAAATRFAVGASGRLPAGPLLTAGATAAAAGSLLLASASTPVVALAGLALAAAGTSVLFPTLLREALRGVRAEMRGRATSAVATTAYLGFVLGPVYVGVLAAAAGLRTAVVGIAALAGVTAVIAWPVARWSRRAGTLSAAAGERGMRRVARR